MPTALRHLVLAACVALPIHAQQQPTPHKPTDYTVHSPNFDTGFTIQRDSAAYTVRYSTHSVLAESQLGLTMQGDDPWGPVHVSLLRRTYVNTATRPVWGKSARIRNHYNEAAFLLREQTGARRTLTLIVRAYNDGIAFRYLLPQSGKANQQFTLSHEDTTFHLADDAELWAGETKSFHHAYEQPFPHTRVSALKPGAHVVLPLLAKTNSGVYAAILEADLNDWAGMYLNPNGTGFSVDLSPRLDKQGLVHSTLPHASPWRVIMLSDRAGEFIESNIIESLNPPSKIRDTSWIKPGKSAWDHWWSGDVQMDNDTIKRYITFAGSMGFPYQLIDWQWYGKFNSPDADITRPAPQLDMPMLLQFAKDHNVREWLWIHSGDVTRFKDSGKLDAAFALYEQWGIAGVKIDFMDSNDQAMVNWYTDVVSLAARHHLMVDFHGAFVPTGLRVTWPNLLTREGVMGEEYFQFSELSTPTHRVTLPFTRMIAGPMDYTPGAFRNRSPQEWKKTKPTEVIGTRAQELALFVIYYSPFTCVSDDPEHYYNQPGLDFLKVVPTTWDETRTLEGTPGEDVVVARRKANTWFVGGITGDKAEDYNLNLSFLGPGNYTAHIYADPANPENISYETVDISSLRVNRKSAIKLPMRPAGGFAMYIEPAK